MARFTGLKLESSQGEVGYISGSYGTEGQFRVDFPGGSEVQVGAELCLRFKKFRGDATNEMVQDMIKVGEAVGRKRILTADEDERKHVHSKKDAKGAKEKTIHGIVEKNKGIN